jgi:hypothetical protein
MGHLQKRVTNGQLKMWKKIWDIFISDVVFREFYTGHPSYDLVVSDTSKILANKGTLYIPPKNKRDSEGHFIAFEKKGKDIRIFDPSSYAYQQFQNNPFLELSIGLRSGKSVVKLTNHPQDYCEGDTFCQTWSIAWINDRTRKLTQPKNKTASIDSMYKIVRTISNSTEFIGYLLFQENLSKFNKIIKGIQKEFKVPDSTCIINDVSDFVFFSQNIKKEDIARILLNTV